MAKGENHLELLRAAIARHAGAVLSLPLTAADGGEGAPLRHYKSRFLADGGDGLWVAAGTAELPLIRELIERRGPVGISFRSGHTKIIFASPVLHLQSDYPGPGGTGTIDALLLRFPGAEDVRATQRRKTYRVPVHPQSELKIRLWPLAEEAHLRDKPSAKLEMRCDLFDVSVAGLGVVIHGAPGKTLNAKAGDRVRVQLTLRQATVMLEGRLRYEPRPVAGGESFRVGVQLKTLGDGREDRRALIELDRIVNEVQRESIRRRKIAAA